MTAASQRSTVRWRTYALLVAAALAVWFAMHSVFGIPLAARLTQPGATPGARLGLYTPGFLYTLLYAGLLYPVLEEIVFRGAVQGLLLRYLPSAVNAESLAVTADNGISARHFTLGGCISLANILTSLLFAAMHLFNQPPLWAMLVFFPSLVFGWAREASGALWAPILLHMFYNIGFFLLFVQ